MIEYKVLECQKTINPKTFKADTPHIVEVYISELIDYCKLYLTSDCSFTANPFEAYKFNDFEDANRHVNFARITIDQNVEKIIKKINGNINDKFGGVIPCRTDDERRFAMAEALIAIPISLPLLPNDIEKALKAYSKIIGIYIGIDLNDNTKCSKI